MTILTSGHGITLGTLAVLAGGQPVTNVAGFTTEVSADGTDWGNPSVVIAQIVSALRAGDIVEETHVGNRTATLFVRVIGTTSNHLTLGERAIMAAVRDPFALAWQPPDAAEPVTVFDVLHTQMEWQWDDQDELRRERSFRLTLTCLPYTRPLAKTVTNAVVVSAPTVLDTGSATTNWTASGVAGASVSVVSGAVTASYNSALVLFNGYSGINFARAFPSAVSTTTNKFFAVDWKSSLPSIHKVNANANPYTDLVEVRREPAPVAGFTRSWYRVSDDTTSVSSLLLGIIHPTATGTATLSIDQVLQANALPSSTSALQKYATITPAGSVTTEGDVLVQHATSGLGTVLVYSHPAGGGYSPPLRPWLVAPTTGITTSSGAVSGASHDITATTRYNIPVASMPRGDVQLWARLGLASGSPGNVAIFWSAWSLMGGTVVGESQQSFTRVNFPALNGWVYAPLARLTLPTAEVGPSGYIYIDIQRDAAATQSILLDEAWLFAMDKGQLTVVDCGVGTPSVGTVHNRLRISAPSLDEPNGSIEVATRADWADSFVPSGAKVLCDQRGHKFDPFSGSNVLTATNVADAATSFEHYSRWGHNVGTP